MQTVTRVSRAEYLALMQTRWRQGEHIVLCGPTGCGKTTLARDLLTIRSWVCVLAIKPHDDSLERYRKGYRIITKWPPEYNQNRVVLWLKPKELGDFGEQRAAIVNALQQIYLAGGWCICLDDLSYMIDHMRLRNLVAAFLNQGRSNGISVVSAVQRPRRVPLETFSQARHILAWRYDDVAEVQRVAEIAGYPTRALVELNAQLGPFDAVSMSSRQAPIIISAK